MLVTGMSKHVGQLTIVCEQDQALTFQIEATDRKNALFYRDKGINCWQPTLRGQRGKHTRWLIQRQIYPFLLYAQRLAIK
jgi:hypothetical protein